MFRKIHFLLFSLLLLASSGYAFFIEARQALVVSYTTDVPAQLGEIVICEGTTLTFTDTSTDVPLLADYLWEFEGASPSTYEFEGPVNVEYNTPGTYEATLTINGNAFTQTIQVTEDLMVQPVLSVPSWGQRNFGGEDYFTFCSNITANEGFVANFAFQTESINTTDNAQHTIATDDGSWSVSFTGANYNNADNFYEFFLESGFHTIIYTIVEGGCTYERAFELYVGANPTATITNEGVPILCENTETSYSISYGAQNGPGTVYEISVDDEVVAVFNHPPPDTFTFTFEDVSCGEQEIEVNGIVYNNAYEMSLTAYNACGQSTNSIVPIYIESGPEADLTLNSVNDNNIIVCEGSTILATDITIPGNNVSNLGVCDDSYNHFWEIVAPDGTILSSSNAGVLDLNPYVTVVGNMGYVPSYPILDNLSGASWSGNATGTLTLEFLQTGTFYVNIYTGSSGQSNQCGVTMQSKTICVVPEVNAQFELNSLESCGPLNIETTNTSSEAGCGLQNIYTWTVSYSNPDGCSIDFEPDWSFVNNTNSQSFEPEFEFLTPGIYTVNLNVALDDIVPGDLCQFDDFSQTVIVKGPPRVEIPEIIDLCQNSPYVFDLESYNCYASDSSLSYTWNFDADPSIIVSDLNVLNPELTVLQPGIYPYSLTLVNSCGSFTVSGNLDVYAQVLVDVDALGTACANDSVLLSGSINGGVTSGNWSASVVGGSFLPNANDLNATYLPPTDFVGTISLTLSSDDPLGPCPAVTDSVDVEFYPEAIVNVGEDVTVCMNATIDLDAQISGGAISGNWSDTVGGQFSDMNSLQTSYTPPLNYTGTIELSFTSNDPVGPCPSTMDSLVLEVIPYGDVTPIEDVVVCAGNQVDLPAFLGTVNGTEFVWTNTNTDIGLTASGTGNLPDFTALNTTNEPILATITVKPSYTSAGVTCMGTEYAFNITVQPTPTLVFSSANQVLCSGGSSVDVAISSPTSDALIEWTIASIPAGLLGVTQTMGTNQIPSFDLINNTQSPIELSINVEVSTGGSLSCPGISTLYTITILPDADIDSQPLAYQTICAGGQSNDLNISYSDFYTNATVTWYQNDVPTNTGGTAVGAGDSYSPGIFSTSGDYYFYATLELPDDGCDATVSDVATIHVLEDPTVILLSEDQSVCQDTGLIDPIVVQAGGSPNDFEYRFWVSNTNDYTNATPVTPWQASNSFAPPTDITGTFYYFCEVRYTIDATGVLDCLGTSLIQTIIINENPSVIEQPLANQTVCLNDNVVDLSMELSYAIGTPTYQWYINNTNSNVGGVEVTGAIQEVFTPPTDAVGVFYYYCISQLDPSCEPAVSEVARVEVGPVPQIGDRTLTVCSGDTLDFTPTALGAEIIPNGSAYTWTVIDNPDVSGYNSVTIPQSTISQTLVNMTPSLAQVQYVVTPISSLTGSCEGESFNLYVTVEPSPSISDKYLTTCSGDSLVYDVFADADLNDIVPLGTTLTWIAQDNPSIIGESNGSGAVISQTLSNTSLSPQEVILDVIPTTPSGCVGESFQVHIMVDSSQILIQDKAVSVCSGGTFTLEPTNGLDGDFVPDNTTYTWTLQPNPQVAGWSDESQPQTSISQTLSHSSNQSEFVVYMVTPNAGDCLGPDFEISVEVFPEPDISVVGETFQEACSGGLVEGLTFSSSVSGSSFNWALTNTNVPNSISGYPQSGSGNLPNFNVFNTAEEPFVLTYEVWASANACDGPPEFLEFTIYPLPTVDLSSTEQTICSQSDSQEVLLSSLTSGVLINWSVSNVPATIEGLTSTSGVGDIPSFLLSNTGITPVTLDFEVYAETNNTLACQGATAHHLITINPESQLSIVADFEICSGSTLETINFSSPTQPNNAISYEWEVVDASPVLTGYVDSGSSTSIPEQTIFNNSAIEQSLTYEVTTFYNSCPGMTQVFEVVVLPIPVIDDTSFNLCSSSELSVDVTDFDVTGNIVPTGTVFTWTVAPNPLVTGYTDSPTVAQESIVQNLVNTTDDIQTVLFTVQPISAAGCPGTPFDMVVEVYPKPFAAPYSLQVCGGDILNATPLDIGNNVIPSSTQYTWIVNDNPNVIGDSQQLTPVDTISFQLLNTLNTIETLTYTVTPYANTCEGDSFDVVVEVLPTPSITNLTLDPICSGSTFNYSPENDPENGILIPSGTTYTWTVNSPSTVTGSADEATPQTSISQALSSTSHVVETVIYTVTPESQGCQGDSFELIIPVDPVPTILSSETLDICSGSAFSFIPENSIPDSNTIVPLDTQYTWIISSANPLVTGWSDQSQPQASISQTLVNTTDQIQQLTYTVTPMTTSCIGESFELQVVVRPSPFISDITESVCNGSTYELNPETGLTPDVNSVVPTGTLYYWDTPQISGNVSGWTTGSGSSFFDGGTLTNETTQPATVTYTVTPEVSYGTGNELILCAGNPFTVSLTVYGTPNPEAIISNASCVYDATLCDGQIETNPIGYGPFDFLWSNTSDPTFVFDDPTVQNQYQLCPGSYQLQLTDGYGCVHYYNYEVLPPTPVNFNLDTLLNVSCNVNNSSCDGFIVASLSGGVNPYTALEWYTESIPDSGTFDLLVDSGDATLESVCAGRYILKVVDADGCQFTSPIYTIIDLNTELQVGEVLSNYNGFNVSCNGFNDGFIHVSVTGNLGALEYSMQPGNLIDSDLSTSDVLEFDGLTAGTYTLTVTDSNCASGVDLSFTLSEPTQLNATATLVTDPIACNGGTATYQVLASGGLPPYTGTGTYTFAAGVYEVIITDTNGCDTLLNLTVTEPDPLSATATLVNPIECFGGLGSVAVQASGGTPPYTGTGLFDVSAGLFNYTVTDSKGCSYSNALLVSEPEGLAFEVLSVSQPGCQDSWSFDNGSICINISGGVNSYPIGSTWVNQGDGLWCMNGLQAGDYTIAITDENGCATPDVDVITLNGPPPLLASLDSSVNADCETGMVSQLNQLFISGGTPPYQVTWSGGSTCDSADPLCMTTSQNGLYTVFIHDQFSLVNGCAPYALDVIVDLPEIGTASFNYLSNNPYGCDLLQYDLPISFNAFTSGDVVELIWDFGDGSPEQYNVLNPVHTFPNSGTFTVSLSVVDDLGCTDVYTETIELGVGYKLILPTAFTPNEDGINDTIRPLGLCIGTVSMEVYDTWGSIVYKEQATADTVIGWDGTINGNKAENGNYFMVVNAVSQTGVSLSKQTTITLIN